MTLDNKGLATKEFLENWSVQDSHTGNSDALHLQITEASVTHWLRMAMRLQPLQRKVPRFAWS